MGSIFAPDMVAAVSEAGGLGALGCHRLSGEQIRSAAQAIRERTDKPFALNFLLFAVSEEPFAAALAARPKVLAFAWPRGGQELKPYIERAHDIGAKVTFMVSDVAGAICADDPEEAPLSFGQDAGLIHEILPAAEIVSRIVSDAETILKKTLPRLVR